MHVEMVDLARSVADETDDMRMLSDPHISFPEDPLAKEPKILLGCM
jgi:hypothetical protein